MTVASWYSNIKESWLWHEDLAIHFVDRNPISYCCHYKWHLLRVCLWSSHSAKTMQGSVSGYSGRDKLYFWASECGTNLPPRKWNLPLKCFAQSFGAVREIKKSGLIPAGFPSSTCQPANSTDQKKTSFFICTCNQRKHNSLYGPEIWSPVYHQKTIWGKSSWYTLPSTPPWWDASPQSLVQIIGKCLAKTGHVKTTLQNKGSYPIKKHDMVQRPRW